MDNVFNGIRKQFTFLCNQFKSPSEISNNSNSTGVTSLSQNTRASSEQSQASKKSNQSPVSSLFSTFRHRSDKSRQSAEESTNLLSTNFERLDSNKTPTTLFRTISTNSESDNPNDQSFSSRFKNIFNKMSGNLDRSSKQLSEHPVTQITRARTEPGNFKPVQLQPQLKKTKNTSNISIKMPTCSKEVSYLINDLLTFQPFDILQYAIKYNTLSLTQQQEFTDWLNQSLDQYGCNKAISTQDDILHEQLSKIKQRINPLNREHILNKILLIGGVIYKVNRIIKCYAPINPDVYKVEITTVADPDNTSKPYSTENTENNSKPIIKRLHVLYYLDIKNNQVRVIPIGRPYQAKQSKTTDLKLGQETIHNRRKELPNLVFQKRNFDYTEQSLAGYCLLNPDRCNQIFAELYFDGNQQLNMQLVLSIKKVLKKPGQLMLETETLQEYIDGDSMDQLVAPPERANYPIYNILIHDQIMKNWINNVILSNKNLAELAKQFSKTLRKAGIIHGDLHGGNILLKHKNYNDQKLKKIDKNHELRIIDMGLARWSFDDAQHDEQEQTILEALTLFAGHVQNLYNHY
jgi:hypothetical protein